MTVVASARDALQYEPVFVLSTARSYSSVVSTMIGQHPLLYGFPELKLFACPTIGEVEASLPGTSALIDRSPGLVRAVAELVFGNQSLDMLARAYGWLWERSGWHGEHVFDLLMRHISPRIAVEKSPEHALSDSALQRISAAYPRCRYIHVTRHPVTAQASMRRYMRASDEYSMTFCFYSWYETNFRLVELGKNTPSDRYLRVRAEDVLNDPRPHLGRIARWLGVPADECSIDAMQHPERSPFAYLVPGWGGGNDPEFLRDPTPRQVDCPATVEQPADWSGPVALWSAVAELGGILGYPAGGRNRGSAGPPRVGWKTTSTDCPTAICSTSQSTIFVSTRGPSASST